MLKFAEAKIIYYIEWLDGFFKNGGKPTHYYDYPWTRAGFLLATDDFKLGGECGANARPILIPSNVSFLGGELGHNTLYFQQDFGLRGRWVPIYADNEFEQLPREVLEPFIAEEKRKQREFRKSMNRKSEEARIRTKDSDLSQYLGT